MKKSALILMAITFMCFLVSCFLYHGKPYTYELLGQDGYTITVQFDDLTRDSTMVLDGKVFTVLDVYK